MSQDEATSWLEKAKGDLDVVRRSLMPLPDKNLEAAAYHCQQAAEKSIKALLQGNRVKKRVTTAWWAEFVVIH